MDDSPKTPRNAPNARRPFYPLHWLPEIWAITHRRLQPQVTVMLLSVIVGIVAGLGAVLFYVACQVIGHYALALPAGYDQAAPGGEAPFFAPVMRPFLPWLLLVIPAVGGLLSGWLVYSLAPEAEGHGTDAAIDAYHNRGGVIRLRVPIIKLLSSALTLGTGGSGGREGPIAQIGAGFGSLLGRILRLDRKQRRVLMAAGMGAGIAAIFRAPIAGALFAGEVLYRSPDFESDVIIPAGLASVTAYCTFGLTFGWDTLFSTTPGFLNALTFNNPWHLLGYTLLVPFLVLLAMVYTHSFYGFRNLFRKLPVRRHFRPMIGAFLTGIVALAIYFILAGPLAHLLPRGVDPKDSLAVLSVGYGILQRAFTVDPVLEASYAFAILLLLVAFGKLVATGLTIGSGGSGGVFGPSVIIGGCGSGALGICLHNLWPWFVPHPAAFVIVGMAGFFSAAAKTPFTSLIIVSEMTGGYTLLLPAMWVCTLAFLLSDEKSIYESQLESPALSPAHQGDYIHAVLAGLSVRQFLKPGQDVPRVAPNDLLATVIAKLSNSTYQTLPVADAAGKLAGVVNLEDVHLASLGPDLGPLVLATDLMRRVEPLHPDDPLDRAVELFAESNLDALPVVDGEPSHHVVGLVRRSDITGSYLQHVHGEPVTFELPT